MERTVNWGILSAGLISTDFAWALKLNCPGAVVYAVGARSQERANEFGAKFGAKVCYSSYEALAEDPNVDIIYVGTIHPQHKAAVALAQKNGKAVLCEKPFTLNSLELTDLITVAREKKLYLSEAMWMRYFPAVRKVNELITTGALGDIKVVNGTFGFQVKKEANRLSESDLGGGALLDIGVYLLSIAFLAFPGQSPKINATAEVVDGVDHQTSMVLTFANGHANLTCGITSAYYPNEIDIIGSKGYIKIKKPFWCPTNIFVNIEGKEENLDFPLPAHDSSVFHYNNSIGLGYEAQGVQAAFLAGKLESEEISLDESLRIMNAMDSIRMQIGVTYKNEQRAFQGLSQ